MTNLKQRLQQTREALRPPEKLILSKWAEEHFRLSPEASAEPGRYYVDRCEYQREILDVVGNSENQEVVLCLSAQTGKTSVLLISLLAYIARDPAPILFVQPTIAMAQTVSKDRLTPALRDCPTVGKLIGEQKSRQAGNTILSKSFPGGTLNIVGANAPSQLASRPVRVVLIDECDRYPISAGEEGSPSALAVKRTATFWNRKVVFCSTPTVEGTSEIWARFEASDQRHFHLECQHCKDYFVPTWEMVKWEKAEDGSHLPETALLYCPHCGGGHTDSQRNQAIRNGHWVAKFPERKIAGFHLNAIQSPFSVLSSLVVEWLSCQLQAERLKTFINTVLGLPFKPKAESVEDLPLMSRVEPIGEDRIPREVSILTLAVDTQKDRLEALLIGHGPDREKYVLAAKRFYGSPDQPQVFQDLLEYIKTTFTRQDGYQLRIATTLIDSGGASTAAVHNFTAQNAKHRVFSIKGAAGNRKLWPTTASHTKHGVGKVYIVGVDTGKEQVYSQLKFETAGPGYVHFSDSLTPEFFEQLTAERRELKYKNGYAHWVWILPNGKHNEALDMFVYNLAALESTGVSPERRAKAIEKRKAQEELKASDPIELPNNETPEAQPDSEPVAKAQKTRTVSMRRGVRPTRQSAWL